MANRPIPSVSRIVLQSAAARFMISTPQRDAMNLQSAKSAFSSSPFQASWRKTLLLVVMLAAASAGLLWNMLHVRSPIFYESDPIEAEISRIKAILQTLPMSPTLASPSTLGYSSAWDDLPESPLTIEVEFGKPEAIDLVAVLPSVFIDDTGVRQSFGFPVRFSLELLLQDGSVQLIADYLEKDYPEVGMGPQLFPCANPVPTRGLRISVTRRSPNPTWWPTSHLVALSEVFAFAGERNVALHGKVTATSSFDLQDAWATSFLTDGFSLFSPIHRKLHDPTQYFRGLGDEVRLEMDLGKERRIDEFRLWPVVQSIQHNFPAMSGNGFPQSFRVELASTSDFSDARVFFEEKHFAGQAGGGPWMRRADPVTGRFVRITLKDGIRDVRRQDHAEINLAEIEVLENGQAVSRSLPFLAPGTEAETAGLSLLTDGLVSEGKVLPLRKWITQFHQQVELSQELKALWPAATEARIRDGKRSAILLFIAIGLILALAQMVWLVRVAAHRRWARMRERIACDLHDEIGANVSSIAHTAELLKETLHEPSETQSRLLCNLIDSAHLTTRETKHFVRFIENEEQDRDLTEQFAQVSNRILGTIPASFSLENTPSFNALDPTTKWNLLLFYKEALNNIIKHAGATAVEIHTRRTGSNLHLEIIDNGRGMPKGSANSRHLESRSKVLGGQLAVHSNPAGGTRVTLTFNRNSRS